MVTGYDEHLIEDMYGRSVRVAMIRLPEVEARTGMKKSWIYREVRANRFPQPVKMSPQAIAWVESEIDHWIKMRIADCRQTHGGR